VDEKGSKRSAKLVARFRKRRTILLPLGSPLVPVLPVSDSSSISGRCDRRRIEQMLAADLLGDRERGAFRSLLGVGSVCEVGRKSKVADRNKR
jgi:hypothetical protein